jgi:hypothetical protein
MQSLVDKPNVVQQRLLHDSWSCGPTCVRGGSGRDRTVARGRSAPRRWARSQWAAEVAVDWWRRAVCRSLLWGHQPRVVSGLSENQAALACCNVESRETRKVPRTCSAQQGAGQVSVSETLGRQSVGTPSRNVPARPKDISLLPLATQERVSRTARRGGRSVGGLAKP